MLCELPLASYSFLAVWLQISLLGLFFVMLMSGTIFYFYYANPTYATWKQKINPKYPSPDMVRTEVLLTLKGMLTATLCPALSLYLKNAPDSQVAVFLKENFGLESFAYCGVNPSGIHVDVLFFFLVWFVSDFYEFFFHFCGHYFSLLWTVHKHHHRFYNPSPFAVIADEPFDQFWRSLPLLAFPLVTQSNMDVLFFTYATFFYGYGAFLHWGHEFRFLSAHNKFLNTSYHHYYHHALSVKNKPIYCGFYFKIWDNLFGSYVDDASCICVQCQDKKGAKSKDNFNSVAIPDYDCLLRPSFWVWGSRVAA